MAFPDRFDDFVAEVAAPRPCHHDGCDQPGSYVLRIRLWAKVDRAHHYPPLEATFTLRACEVHRYDVGKSGFWTDEGKDRIRHAVDAVGRAEPDFDTAQFEWVKASTALGDGLSIN